MLNKVLIVTDVSFWEKSSGNRIRINSLISFLSDHTDLTVVATGPFQFYDADFLSKNYKAKFLLLEKKQFLDSSAYGRKIKTALGHTKFDAIIIEYIHCSFFLNYLNIDAKLILDAHDVISYRTQEFKKYNYDGLSFELSREKEGAIFKVFDKVLTLTTDDSEIVNEMAGSIKALSCTHPVSVTNHTIRKSVKNLTFIASAYLPNKDSIIHFIDRCWQDLRTRFDIQLKIYGTVCNVLPEYSDPCISKMYFIEDINKIYEDADIIINPVRFGAGLKIKNIEAISHCLPLVTTPHGAKGLEGKDGNAYLIAQSDEDFIEKISGLIIDIKARKRLAKNAASFVREYFTNEKCFDPLLKFINNSN